MTTLRFTVSCLILSVVVACERSSPVPTPSVVAIAGEESILASELREELERVGLEGGLAADDEEGFRALRRGVLEALIDRRLLLAEARSTGVNVSDEEMERLVARRAAALARTPDDASVLSTSDMKGRLREQLLIDRLLVREVVGRTALGPDEAREWYDEHKSELVRGERIRVRQVLTRTHDEAQSARLAALRGVDFAQLARDHSIAPDARTGGDLGWFARGEMPAVVEETSFALRKNQVSEVVSSPWGFHVIKVVDRDEGRAPDFSTVEKSIELELRRERVAQAQTEYMRRLRERVGVTIHDAELERVRPFSSETNP